MRKLEFNTPILLIAWRRPEHLSKVIDAIRKVKPTKVFVAVDGPRIGDEYFKERELIQETKKVVESKIDWECDLTTLYRDENMGCARGVSSAITWFFEHVEEGIILEDDIVPRQSFFNYMEKSLSKFRDDKKVYMINASTNEEFLTNLRFSFTYKSKFSKVWGWATYRDRWAHFKLFLDDLYLIEKTIERELLEDKDKKIWKNIASSCFYDFERVDTWDYQWQFTIWENSGYSITPNKWLIDNIGFGDLAIHTVHKTNRKVSQMIENSQDQFESFQCVHFPIYSTFLIKILNKIKKYV